MSNRRMTDYERTIHFLESLPVGYTVHTNEEIRIVLTANEDKNVKGYNCFCTEIVFDDEGTFQQWECWE